MFKWDFWAVLRLVLSLPFFPSEVNFSVKEQLYIYFLNILLKYICFWFRKVHSLETLIYVHDSEMNHRLIQ